ncbi:peptidoglycan DD-metalloendopeptidase family protein [soil metagenome]
MQPLLLLLFLLIGCAPENLQVKLTTDAPNISAPTPTADTLWATQFDYPVGPPNAKGYYNAQGFGKNTHLGDDWNGNGGGNTDLGDTVYAIANGYITNAWDLQGGWGNVMRIAHYLPTGHEFAPAVESLYAHLDTMFFKAGVWVRKGTPIGTIGTAHGRYYAHLHLELRERLAMPLGGGYSDDTTGYINPDWFIRKY